MKDDMKVKNLEYDFVSPIDSEDDSVDGNRDWRLALEHATFSHKEASEFIFFIGLDLSIEEIRKAGFSRQFIVECEKAADEGYKYICFYA